MQRVALITGITGQDGSYLSELLLKKKYKVVGLVSKKYNIGWQNVGHIKNKLILEQGDLLDRKSLSRILEKHQPSEIYNLGGLTFVPGSWKQPTLTIDINTLGVARILELIVKNTPKTRFYQASTAKIFGNPQEIPQTESTLIKPLDPYSISKAAAHFLTQAFRREFNVFAVSGILYNHESERRGPEFVTRKITIGAARIKLGLEKQLKLGNLEAKQDWGYAPDYVEAMWLMLQQDQADDYIIATGKLHSVKDICKIAFGRLDLNYQDFVTIDQRFLRKTESASWRTVGNPSKAKSRLKWKPKTSFKGMITKMVEHDLETAKHEARSPKHETN